MGIRKDKRRDRWVAQHGSGKMGTRVARYFLRRADAERWLAEQKSTTPEARQAIEPVPEMMVNELLETYLRSMETTATEKHRADIRYAVKEICDLTGITYLADIASERLERFKAMRVPGHRFGQQYEEFNAARTINKKVKHMKALCSFAVRGGWMATNPLSQVALKKATRTERRALNLDETREVLRAAKENSPAVFYPIIYTMINTGLRKAELLTLEWEDISFDRNEITVKDKPHILVCGKPHTVKWGGRRVIPLRNELKTLLASLPRTSTLVFPTITGGLRWNNFDRGFEAAIRGAGVRNLHEITAHILRHSFISHLLTYAKVDLKTVSVLAGHTSTRTTEVYIHLLGGTTFRHLAMEALPDYGTDDRDCLDVPAKETG